MWKHIVLILGLCLVLPPTGSALRDALTPWQQKLCETRFVYWADSEARTIERAKLSGSNHEILINTWSDSAIAIALDVTGGKMYWTNVGTNTIERASFDGSDREIPVSGLRGQRSIALDVSGDKMYWTNSIIQIPGRINSSIWHANLDGSAPELLSREVGVVPDNIALDVTEGQMYWTSGPRIRRAKLNGSNREILITGQGILRDIALDLGQPGPLAYTTSRARAPGSPHRRRPAR